ncbi:unnamed protein product, partial [Mesorhabditis belari]|uniref:ET module n=1 Tax=Mesorhabditis belari TaxID=2138241 RepID=A0AAF3JC86_9BILA
MYIKFSLFTVCCVINVSFGLQILSQTQTLCGLGDDRRMLIFDICPNQCSNTTNLLTHETTYQCAKLGKCPIGSSCSTREHSVTCCCSANFCNIGKEPNPPPDKTTLRPLSPGTTHQTTTRVTKISSQTTTVIPSADSTTTDLTPTTSILQPNQDHQFVCFTGVTLGFLPSDRWTTGALTVCEGICTNISLALFYVPITAYICDVNQLCTNWAMNSCDYISQGTPMTMCCCNSSSTCNVASSTPLPSPLPSVSTKTETNNTCFIGFSFQNEVPVTMNVSIPANLPVGNFELCGGDCANITLGDFGTLYTCDPISVCVGLTIRDNCSDIVKGLLTGCCCSSHNCNLHNQTQPFKTTTSSSHLFTGEPLVVIPKGVGSNFSVFFFLFIMCIFVNS